MKQSVNSIILLFFTSMICVGQHSTDIDLYEDQKIKIEIIAFSEANILDKNWLSFSFTNKSDDTITIEKFTYSASYDTLSFDLIENRGSSLGQGSKFDVFPIFEAKKNPSKYDVILRPKESVVGYRSISNYASVLLGYDNETNLTIHSKVIAKCKYTLQGKEVEFDAASPEFKFVWKSVESNMLSSRLIDSYDSIHLRGNYWIVGSLSKDTSITHHIPESTYVKLITQNKEDSFSTSRDIIKAFVKRFGYNDELNAFYTTELQKPSTLTFRQLHFYWHDTLLQPLIQSFKINNNNHYQYLSLLDKHHDLWKYNTKLKTEMYNQIMDYASQVLVTNNKLSSENLSGWRSWISELKMTHSKEAEQYFQSFFNNKLPLFGENANPMKFCSTIPLYYPADRACDAALEAYIYSKYGDISKIYSQKFDELVEEGKFKKSSSTYLLRNEDLLDKKNMQVVRNELIKDYRK